MIAELDVLIVEDHEAMRALLMRVLGAAGVTLMREAEDAETALGLLRERPATLILVDQNMPGMDGAGFIAAVRADASLGAPRILMITGHAEARYAEAARAAGADGVLVKPVSPRTLLAAIDAL